MTGSTFCDGVEWLARSGTVGKPFRSTEVLVADWDGRPLPPGEAGGVFICSPWTRTLESEGSRLLRTCGDGFFLLATPAERTATPTCISPGA